MLLDALIRIIGGVVAIIVMTFVFKNNIMFSISIVAILIVLSYIYQYVLSPIVQILFDYFFKSS